MAALLLCGAIASTCLVNQHSGGRISTAPDRFYHPSFVMFSNGVTQDFDTFAASHRTIYATPIRYSVERLC